jgi:formylglycine-generating enzyme required for sulfatase activity
MATFGRFEAVREIYRMGYTAVYTGRSPESTEEKYAIKILQPPALLLEAEQVKTQIDLFLKSADLQQKVAAAGAPHWAPVHECGSTAEGAFYVTEKYEHSLQRLVDVRLKLSGEALGGVVESVARGLLELKQSHGRPHGNLKSTNVLIRGTGDISQRQIVLSDPLPQEFIDTEVHWDSDLRAIAEFIYQLVIHRPSPVLEGWQAPDSKEWHRLGKQAVFWRGLCNRLLSAAARPGTMTVETLLEDLTQLEKIRPARSYRWLVAAGLIIIASTIAIYVLLKKPPPANKAEWQELCQEYIGWIRTLDQDLKSEDLAGHWGKNGELKGVLEQIKLAAYPDRLAKPRGTRVEDIMDDPNVANDNDTKLGLKAVEKIKSFFDPNSSEPWPLLSDMNEAASQFNKHRWYKAAGCLQNLVVSVKPGLERSIAKAVDTILEIEETLRRIDSQWKTTEDCKQSMQDPNYPVLGQLFGAYVESELVTEEAPGTKDDLYVLRDRLAAVSALANELTEIIKGERGRSDSQTPSPGPDGSTQTLAAVPFPHWLKQVADVEERNRQLRIIESDPKYDDEVFADGFRKRLAAMHEELLQMIGSREPQAVVTNRAEALSQRLEKLQMDVTTRYVAVTVDPKEWVPAIRNLSGIAVAEAVNQEWRRRRDLELDKEKHSLEKLENASVFLNLKRTVEQTRARLESLDNMLPAQVDAPARPTEWTNNLRDIHRNKREEIFGEIVQWIRPQEEVPDVKTPQFEEKWRSRLEDFQSWRAELGQLMTAFDQIEQGLNACYLLEDKLPQTDQTPRSLWERWKDSAILRESIISDALASVTSRVGKLKEIETLRDRLKLVSAALAPGSQTEMVYAAWKNLGELTDPPWPDPHTEDEPRTEGQIHQNLDERFASIEDENRKESLKGELEKGGKRRDIVMSVIQSKDLIAQLRDRLSLIQANSLDTGGSVYGIFAKFTAYVNGVIVTGQESCDAIDQNTLQAKTLQELQRADETLSASKQRLQGLTKPAEDVALLLQSDEWKDDPNYSKDLFESDMRKKLPVETTPQIDWAGIVQDWQKSFASYRILKPDPLQQIDDIVLRVQGRIEQDLFGGEQQERQKELSVVRTKLQEAKANLPGIELYRKQILDECAKLITDLKEIEGKTKPEFCRRLDRLGNGQLVFVTTTTLRANFEPVRPDGTIPELGRGWGEIRKAVDEGQREWIEFFYTTDVSDKLNVGWPRYIRSAKDPSVVLSFIPAGPGNPEPFYMATREITNAQYLLFLEKTKAGYNRIRETFSDPNGIDLIGWTTGMHPCQIRWDQTRAGFEIVPGQENVPVTWVTDKGAGAYAKQLGAQLPTASQNVYACMANANTTYPWGNDPSDIARYAHVRGAAWQREATEYNRRRQEETKSLAPSPVALRPPVGAVADFLDGDTKMQMLNPTRIVHQQDTYPSPWPIASKTEGNGWGLYDMIGNVWEWCRDGEKSVICGGSCLSPPEYARPGSTYPFDGPACDVGFRIVVPDK